MAEPLVWPFLVVLMSEAAAAESEDMAEAPRPCGLGWLVGDYLVTLAQVGDRADTAITAVDGREMRVERLPPRERFGLFRVDDENARRRADSLTRATPGAECAVAMVRDDAPNVRLLSGRVDKEEPDGRFIVVLDSRLPEDYIASGSPVVSADGAVIGIVGSSATSFTVDAFGLDVVKQLIAEAQAPTDQPSLAISEVTRSALGYALDLATTEGSAIGAAAAVLLGVLRSTVNENRQTVPRDLLTFISQRRGLDATTPNSILVDEAIDALDLRVSDYPPDPPPDDATLQGPVLAPVLAAAEAFRVRIDPEERLQRRFLLAAVLTQPVTSFPPPLFDSLGITLPELREALREAVAGRPNAPVELWNDALAEPPQTLFDLAGGISADRVDPTKGIPIERDNLGVRDYVTMFATLIAEKQTPMPLSFGLFGEWGSGKSYFMGLLRAQVAALAGSTDGRYHSEIVQIGFNAWHYSDSNLWASLGDEIFERLAGPAETNEQRREHLREELGQKLQRRKELEDASKHANFEIDRLTRDLGKAMAGREASAATLAKAVLGAPELRTQLDEAWTQLAVDKEVDQIHLLAGELNQTPADIDVLRQALGGWRSWLVLAALLVAIAAVALGAAVSRSWLTGTGFAIVSGVAVIASWLIVRVRSGARLLHEVADGLRRQRAAEITPELEKLQRAQVEQSVVQTQLDEVTGQVGEIGRELAELSPGQQLYRFIAERAASDTYRGQLGLISTIRKDFEQLIELMEDWHKRGANDPTTPRAIDRIVLYIDDLDRCSPEQVVDVLQAVHLLLALELFVVVVGVDPRWLLRALRRQYRSMLTTGSRPTGQDPWWDTTPQDYLEKIFNIPFALPRMSPGSFQQLVRSLTAPPPPPEQQHDEGVAQTETTTSTAPTELAPKPASADGGGEAEARAGLLTGELLPVESGSEVASLQSTPAELDVRPLTDPELTMLAALAPLVETPRETKRLLNLYRMIRSTRNLTPASRFLGDDHTPGEYEAVVILLGLLSGHARLLEDVLAAQRRRGVKGGLLFRDKNECWADFVAGMQPRRTRSSWANDIIGTIGDADVAGWSRLSYGLAEVSKLVTIPDLGPFQLWAPRIARFSFLLSPYAQGESAV